MRSSEAIWRGGVLAVALLALGRVAVAEEAPTTAGATARDAAATPAATTAARTPEGQSFRVALTVWREAANALRKAASARPSKEEPPEERRKRIDALARDSDTRLDELIASAKAAYAADADDKDVRQFLEFIAALVGSFDRLEETLELLQILADHGVESPALLNLRGRSAFELGDPALAVKCWKRSAELGDLDPDGKKYLAEIDKWAPALEEEIARREQAAASDDLPRILFRTTRGDFTVELYEDDFPNTVANLVYLVEQKFYQDLPIFRVMSGFGATIGCPQGNGSGGPGHELENEAAKSGKNRPHLRGTLAMVTTRDGVHGSQFFIKFRLTNGGLTTDMPVFGRVIDGMPNVARFQRVEPYSAYKHASADRIIEAKIVRKRDHEYFPDTVGTGLASVKKAIELSKNGKVPEATRLLKEAVEKNPELFEAHYSLALIYLQTEQARLASRHFLKATEIRPNHAEAHFYMGILFASQQNLNAAIDEFKEAIRLNPALTLAYNNLASMLAQQGKKDEAEQVLVDVLKIDPNYKQARDNLAKLRAQRDALDKQAPKKKEESEEPATADDKPADEASSADAGKPKPPARKKPNPPK